LSPPPLLPASMAIPKRKIEMSEAFWTSLKRMKYDLDSPTARKVKDNYNKYSRCDVLDYHMGREVWRTCRILQIDSKHHAVFVHWEGWGHHWDEWIDLSLGRRIIAPLWTKVPRLTRTGKQCEFSSPLSIGFAGPGGAMIKLAPRGTPFYPSASMTLSTCIDQQRKAKIRVYQGERPFAEDNKYLGEFDVTNIPPASQGVPQIQVTLCLHPDGLLSIRAHCESGSPKFFQATDSEALAGMDIHDIAPKPEEIEVVLEAEKVNRAEDRQKLARRGDPWEERKCRQWSIDKILKGVLGKDVAEIIQEYDDELQLALCVAPVGGMSPIADGGGIVFPAEDGDNDDDDAAPPLLDTSL